MKHKNLALGAVLSTGLLVVGCTHKTAADGSLLTAIQSKLYADSSTRAANIKVDVKDGVVTLSGDVPTSDVELEAMKVANATPGIRSVSDQMKVNAAAAGAPAGAPPPDAAPPPANGPAPGPAAAQTAAAPPPAYPPPTAPADEPPAAPVRKAPVAQTVAAGSRLSVRMIDAIDSKKNSVGQSFRASLEAPLTHGNRVIVPAGAPVTVLLSNKTSAGRVRGNNELELRVTSLSVNGKDYEVASDVYDQSSKGKGKQTAIRSGIGAAAGALIGGLAGGGKGAAIGAGAGGGAGFGYQFFTHGSQVKVPSETVLTFQTTAPISIRR